MVNWFKCTAIAIFILVFLYLGSCHILSIIEQEKLIDSYASKLEQSDSLLLKCEESLSQSTDQKEALEAKILELDYQISRLETLGGYREFESLDYLREWLASDSTSENTYIENDYDCDDFAVDLTLSALQDGYWIGLIISANHMFNFTIIGNDVYFIEAETDVVYFWCNLD